MNLQEKLVLMKNAMLQKHPRHIGEGSQSTLNDQTSPHQNAQGIKPGVPEDQLDLAGMYRNSHL